MLCHLKTGRVWGFFTPFKPDLLIWINKTVMPADNSVLTSVYEDVYFYVFPYILEVCSTSKNFIKTARGFYLKSSFI